MESRGSVLVVDDEPTITDVVSRYLERAGYTLVRPRMAPLRSSLPGRHARTSWCST